MTLEQLKDAVQNNSYDGCLIILTYSDSKFIPVQYLNKIIQDKQWSLDYRYEIDNSIISVSDLFGMSSVSQCLRVFDVDIFDYSDSRLIEEKNLIIICKKVAEEVKRLFQNYIINIPKLEDWQIKDYVYSLLDGIKESDLDTFINLCGNNIYRIESEVAKIILFKSELRQKLFNEFQIDGVFSDLTDATVFDLADAILKKDVHELLYIYKQIDCMDVSPIGLVSILYQSVKNIIKIQLTKNSTPESVGIAKNKFFAIKYNYVGKYSRQQLINLFLTLTDIDKRIKTSQLDVEDIIDYLIVYVFSVR